MYRTIAGNEKCLVILFDLCLVQSKRRKGVKEQPPIPKSVHLIDCAEKESDDEDTGEERDSFAFVASDILLLKESLTSHQDTLKMKYTMN